MAETEETGEKKEAGKFGKAADDSLESIKKAPEETQQKYHSVSSKGDSLKILGAEVLSSSSKDDLKLNYPKQL